MAERRYSSPLRASQAQRTRDVILDALTELLSERPAYEIATREIAERAGVSQPTVYRHFPDRQALLEGLADRIAASASSAPVESLEGLIARGIDDLARAEAYAVEASAEALLNADPRRLSRASRARTEELRQFVADSFPEYGERDHVRITALIRNIYSGQTWFRMREEFGIRGDESGPILAWALAVLIREIRAGNFPRGESRPDPSASDPS